MYSEKPEDWYSSALDVLYPGYGNSATHTSAATPPATLPANLPAPLPETLPTTALPATIPAPENAQFCATVYDVDIPNVSQLDLAQKILKNYKSQTACVREDFLEDITSMSRAFLDMHERRSLSRNNAAIVLATATASVIDRVFSYLEPYIDEVNDVVGGTPLAVSCTYPTHVTESIEYDHSRQPRKHATSYRGRISTGQLSIVVRGEAGRIEFYLLPVEMVMGLRLVEDQFKPLMTFTGQFCEFDVDWEVEEKPLTAERFERYVLLLFKHLLEQTQEQLV